MKLYMYMVGMVGTLVAFVVTTTMGYWPVVFTAVVVCVSLVVGMVNACYLLYYAYMAWSWWLDDQVVRYWNATRGTHTHTSGTTRGTRTHTRNGRR